MLETVDATVFSMPRVELALFPPSQLTWLRFANVNLPLSRLLFLSPNDGSAALPWSFVPTAVVRFRASADLGAVLDSTVFLEEARLTSFLSVFVEAKIIPLTRGGCPPLPPPDEAMRVRVLRVLLLLLLLLLFVHAGV